MNLLYVSSVVGLIVGLGAVAGCDYVPDADVQFRCEGDRAAELCVHAANAAAELRPHVYYEIVVSNPDDRLATTWRSADQWVIKSAPDGYQLPDGAVLCQTPLGATSYLRRTIYVCDGVWTYDGWDLGSIVRHEIGHALGVTGHPTASTIMRPALEWGTGPQSYDATDIALISSRRAHDRNDIIDAVWPD